LGSPSKFECGKTCIKIISGTYKTSSWAVIAIKNSKIYIDTDTICFYVRVAKFFGYAMYTCV